MTESPDIAPDIAPDTPTDGVPPTPTPAKKKQTGSRKPKGGKRRDDQRQSGPRERVAPGGPRHMARIMAMQVLYEVDVADHSASDVLARTFDDPDLAGEDDAPEPAADALGEVHERVERLVRGVLEHFREIDPYIAAAAPAFPIAQLPAVDRNVLRLAVYELLREPDVPPRAAINEAVELAKRFGGDNSSRFVNGVLGTIAARVDADRANANEPPAPPVSDAASEAGSEEPA